VDLADGNSVEASTTSHAEARFKVEKKTVAGESAMHHSMRKILDLK
jgi:hypothetical protein